MAYSKTKNLLKSRDVYNRYYGDFRGVDFSSDHTQVIEQRLAYAVNMYKDYQSGQGKALETIPGFRRRVALPNESVIYGVHYFQQKDNKTKVLIHSNNALYLWSNYPNPKVSGALNARTLTITEKVSEMLYGVAELDITSFWDTGITKLEKFYYRGEDVTEFTNFDSPTYSLIVNLNGIKSWFKKNHDIEVNFEAGDEFYMTYYAEARLDLLFEEMNNCKSTSFVFNNRLYIIDGKNYIYYDGSEVKSVLDSAYIPTTYINIVPSEENGDTGTEYEHRNWLQPKFKNTFIADGTTSVFYMSEKNVVDFPEIKVYGEKLTGIFKVSFEEGWIELPEPPKKPEDNGYPEGYAGVEITAQKKYDSAPIVNCNIAAIFDDRVFLSGNPDHPNNVYFCGRNNATGYVDPTYFPVTNYVQDGVGMAPITGMLPVADTLMVLKSDTQQDGSVYFHTAYETGDNLHPKDYPSVRGLAGIGCLGACINFLDDPVFISRLGVEAVGQLSTRLERAIEHRSSLVDAKLVNMNLENAVLEEWNGYLVVLIDGKIFLADSRQRYTHETGVMQYEWYYLEDIGVFDNQYLEFRYASQLYSELEGKEIHYCTKCNTSEEECTCGSEDNHISIPLSIADAVFYHETGEMKDLRGTVANAPDESGVSTNKIFTETLKLNIEDTDVNVEVHYSIHEVYNELTGEFVEYKAYLCESTGGYTGGAFKKATCIKTIDNNLFFGTENGVLCSFNFDMRDETGEIPPQYYSFDNRTILCGCATKMDCCGVPHLTKNTVKKSTVVKTKTFPTSAAKIKVRTNKKPYDQIARISSGSFSFDNVDFADFSFTTTEQSLFAIKEKEKQWVEKQYYVYSDEYCKPFALYYISFRYNIAGRYKE